MSAVLVSEVRKLTTTRSWIVLLAVTAAAAVVFSGIYVVVGLVGSTSEPPRNMFADPRFVATIYTSGNSAARILAIIAGAMAMGAEFRHKTLSISYLAVPVRSRMVIGKAVVTFAYGLAFGIVATAVAFLAAALMAVIKGGSLFLGRESSWQALLLNIVSLALWTMIGFGFGILIKNMVASVLIAVGFAYIVEPTLNIIFALKHWTVPANLMPSGATTSLVGIDANGVLQTGLGAEQWPAYAGFVVLLGWGVIPALVGMVTTVRRDVA